MPPPLRPARGQEERARPARRPHYPRRHACVAWGSAWRRSESAGPRAPLVSSRGRARAPLVSSRVLARARRRAAAVALRLLSGTPPAGSGVRTAAVGAFVLSAYKGGADDHARATMTLGPDDKEKEERGGGEGRGRASAARTEAWARTGRTPRRRAARAGRRGSEPALDPHPLHAAPRCEHSRPGQRARQRPVGCAASGAATTYRSAPPRRPRCGAGWIAAGADQRRRRRSAQSASSPSFRPGSPGTAPAAAATPSSTAVRSRSMDQETALS